MSEDTVQGKPPSDRVFTVPQLSLWLQVDRRTIYGLIRCGQLPAADTALKGHRHNYRVRESDALNIFKVQKPQQPMRRVK